MVMFKNIAEFDNRVSVYWTNRHFSEKTTKFLKFYVRLGDGYIWALFALCLFLYLGWNAFWPILAQAVVAIVVALVIYEGVKLSTRRPRPFAANPQIKAEVPPLDKYSFPSGHTMNNLAVASAVFFCVPNEKIVYQCFSIRLSAGAKRIVPPSRAFTPRPRNSRR